MTVTGVPAPKGSKTLVQPSVMRESSKLLPAWNTALDVALHYERKRLGYRWPTVLIPKGVPAVLSVAFSLPRPQRIKSGSEERPLTFKDVDKLLRAVGDALTRVRIWDDDGQAVEVCGAKYYAGCLGGLPLPGASIVAFPYADGWGAE